uniref:DEAD/DEAH box RNA helicase putative n=1 Tax=Albugo laibachii Nc14 TaxID=890382 RepID=F0WL81_9STRA|nr:DEAD/DEAH box RNA helicase putative [Albugo laibachii Nc14]|eukprot:CCA22042.1 DEAD/DEAH box RNA helicase putative [Albugo laibachii Nc14]
MKEGMEVKDLIGVDWDKIWPDRMPVILRNLAPVNPFDPRHLWPEENASKSAGTKIPNGGKVATNTPSRATSTSSGTNSAPKLKKADLIRLQLEKDKKSKQFKVDEEKLSNVKNLNLSTLIQMKLGTPTGRLKQLYEILKHCLTSKDMIDAVDTLFEIQSTNRKFLQSSRQKLEDSSKPVKSKGSGKQKDKKMKENAEEDKELKSLLQELVDIHRKYRKYVKKVLEYLSGRDMIVFQLTNMADRLPPLNMHHPNKFVLDEWQRTVLSHIDDHHSVIVCAPTSSGKTVLSTYVTVSGHKVLFVVPTEPLAWQVAALFQLISKNSVAFITDGTVFIPQNYSIVVGTARAIESALIDIGYDFGYAVFDEVHDLNGAEGDSLERIIKSLTCPFLALSATIGNANELLAWWKRHHNQAENIHLLEYSGRFINLQRMIWSEHPQSDKRAEGSSAGELITLHPCTGITVDYLKDQGLRADNLAFTPRDTFALWEAMKKHFDMSLIQDIDPNVYFAHKMPQESQLDSQKSITSTKSDEKAKKSSTKKSSKKKDAASDDEDPIEALAALDLGEEVNRITLMESKKYEDFVKKRLQELAIKDPEATQKLLDSFSVSSPTITDLDSSEPFETETKELGVLDLMQELCTKNLIPAIAFQLDSVRCRQLHSDLVNALETAEQVKHPAFRKKVQQEYEQWKRKRDTAAKREGKLKAKEQEEEVRDAQDFEEAPAPDIFAPHPEFVLTPLGHRLSSMEMKQICYELRRLPSAESGEPHFLIRSLRRGIGIYIHDLPSAYLRVVQSLAQAGRLAVVLSDDSLAYGVNMPFRTCCFCEDAPEDEFTPLMVQQMAGRAGRRGLDRQGNIVFAGFRWKRMQHLMRGLLPDVVGKPTLYPLIALQQYVSPKVDATLMRRIATVPLNAFMTSDQAATNELSCSEDSQKPYLTRSIEFLKSFGFLKEDENLAIDPFVAKFVWECRDNCFEALGIFWILEAVLTRFQGKAGVNIGNQLALCNMMLRIVGRERYDPNEKNTSLLVAMQASNDLWDITTDLLKRFEEHTQTLADDEFKDALGFRIGLDEALDGCVWEALVKNQIPRGLNTAQLLHIKKRLRHIGSRFRLLQSILMYSERYGVLEEIFRKCFRRVKWILIDSDV